MPVPVVYQQYNLCIYIEPQVSWNVESLQENASVLSILHSLKILITSGRHFQNKEKYHNRYGDLVLKTT